jgi:hypothetical protein
VEHPCPRCNASVDDGSPFCPACEAAQVRAATREYSRVPVNVASEVSSTSVATESGTIVAFSDTGPLPSRTTARADAHVELRSALYAGIIAAVLIIIQPASLILAMPLGGFLSVLLHRRRSMGEDPGPRAGFRLGAFTGLFAFGLLLLIAVGTLAFHAQGDMHAHIVRIIQQAQARSVDPQAKQVADYFLTPEGMAFMMIFCVVFMCVLFVLLSGIGGAISASLLRRKGPPKP